MPYRDDEEQSPSEFYYLGETMTEMLRFKARITPNRPNKTTAQKMLQTLFLQHFNGFILHRTFVVYHEKVVALYF